MYWLLNEEEQQQTRQSVENIVHQIAPINNQDQSEQVFPFIGRKDIRKARVVIENLTNVGDRVIDPFSGSGIFTYAAASSDRQMLSNEWEPYAWRMSTAPWDLPDRDILNEEFRRLVTKVKPYFQDLYGATCNCGQSIMIESQFYDLNPLRYSDIEFHNRLPANGETMVFRGKYKCPQCGATAKFFTEADLDHLQNINLRALDPYYADIFARQLIPNSRINISHPRTSYGSFFPHRSKLALQKIHQGIMELTNQDTVRNYLLNIFITIVVHGRYKDYHSKNQDLHIPNSKLRESNLLFWFIKKFDQTTQKLYNNPYGGQGLEAPIKNQDFRVFLGANNQSNFRLMITDPPWSDANPYFEKAQIYHPWLNFDLSQDNDRLENEFVITDAPSRRDVHNVSRWWKDFEEFLSLSSDCVQELGYLVMFFRPSQSQWLRDLNSIKHLSRMYAFEPLLTVASGVKDPSMRIQQSASFAFSKDMIFIFKRIPDRTRRFYLSDIDVDFEFHEAAKNLYENSHGAFTENALREKLRVRAIDGGFAEFNLPKNEIIYQELFNRYLDTTVDGRYYPRRNTPFDGQIFGVEAEERLFHYVPQIVRELTENSNTFTYQDFLLKLAGYVENGTRKLIENIQQVNAAHLLRPYAEPLQNDKFVFRRRPRPALPNGVQDVLDLSPAEFEHFCSDLLIAKGFQDATVIGGSSDFGVDIHAIDEQGQHVVVQCKRWINNVGSVPVQRVHSFSQTRGAQRRIIITTSDFTKDGRLEAQRTNTELINGDDLSQLIAHFLPTFRV